MLRKVQVEFINVKVGLRATSLYHLCSHMFGTLVRLEANIELRRRIVDIQEPVGETMNDGSTQ